MMSTGWPDCPWMMFLIFLYLFSDCLEGWMIPCMHRPALLGGGFKFCDLCQGKGRGASNRLLSWSPFCYFYQRFTFRRPHPFLPWSFNFFIVTPVARFWPALSTCVCVRVTFLHPILYLSFGPRFGWMIGVTFMMCVMRFILPTYTVHCEKGREEGERRMHKIS